MVIGDIERLMESWAPRTLAWEHDNIGLQTGSPSARVQTILVALDATHRVVQEARDLGAQMLIVHHPLIFRPIRSINSRDRVGALAEGLIRSRIALYAAHTNLDFTADGVSVTLARLFDIDRPEFLLADYRTNKKIVVFVPPPYTDSVAAAMSRSGGGAIGRYSDCSFRVSGTGTFRALPGARPSVGTVGKAERVPEDRLEMIVPSSHVPEIIAAIKKSHPYEEVAYDVYDLGNVSGVCGKGTIGDLPRAMPLSAFLRRVQTRLGIPALRYTGKLRRRIRRVAFCGGSGSELVPVAIERGADAFVTADIKYHTMQDAEDRLALIDAGHFETEKPIVKRIVAYLRRHEEVQRAGITVHASRVMNNPVQYFLS